MENVFFATLIFEYRVCTVHINWLFYLLAQSERMCLHKVKCQSGGRGRTLIRDPLTQLENKDSDQVCMSRHNIKAIRIIFKVKLLKFNLILNGFFFSDLKAAKQRPFSY